MSIADEIVDLLKKAQNYTMEWGNIYNLLQDAGYKNAAISKAKSKLIDEGKIKQEIINNKKIITLLETPKEQVEATKDIGQELQQYTPLLTNFFKEFHSDDIIMERELVEIDTTKWIGTPLSTLIDKLIEAPEQVLKFITETYKEVFYGMKLENTDAVVTIKKLPTQTAIENLRSKDLNKLIEFEGIIALASKIKAALVEGFFQCSNCGNTFYIPIDPMNPVKKLPCKCKGEAFLDENKSRYIDTQELKIQQPVEQRSNPDDPPKYMTVIYENAKGIYSGNVRVIGIPIKIISSKNRAFYDIAIRAINIVPVADEKHVDISKEEEELIKKLSAQPNIIDTLADALFPEIKGYETVKKAIFLQQIKGVRKNGKRHNIHILLITDPGVGKSTMLRKIGELPGNTYASVNTSSGVGLTASLDRIKTEIGDDTWVIKPGVIPKAHGGTACLDEFTTKNIQKHLLEIMESQKLKIDKAIHTTLQAETAILAACNPKRGRYDSNLTVWEQINIPAPLLSRFDLIFPLRDYVNKRHDMEIGKHILRINKELAVNEKGISIRTIMVDGDVVKLTPEFIYKYIHYASGNRAILSDEAEEVLLNFYVELRKNTENSGECITARQLESALRLAEAIAKAKLKEVVGKEDAEEAVNILMECYNEIAKDPATGLLDFAKISGVPKSESEKLDLVKDAIMHLEQTNDTPVDFYDLEKILSEKGISEEQLERYLKKLSNFGEVMEVRPGKYKVVS